MMVGEHNPPGRILVVDDGEKLNQPRRRVSRAQGAAEPKTVKSNTRASACWCATRCAAGSHLPPLRKDDELGRMDAAATAGNARSLGGRPRPVRRGARRDRNGPERPRPGQHA